MSALTEQKTSRVAGFRTKLQLTIMAAVILAAAVGIVIAQRDAADKAKGDFQRRFQGELASLNEVEGLRYALLAQRCRELARNSRIHAALEDNALDRLYPSAKDAMADAMAEESSAAEAPSFSLRARFYRFLDAEGAVIPPKPEEEADIGALGLRDESRLAITGTPEKPERGYLIRDADSELPDPVDEIIAMPIVSSETGETIAAIVLGFKPAEPTPESVKAGMKNGLWTGGRLAMPSLQAGGIPGSFATEISRVVSSAAVEGSFETEVNGTPQLVLYRLLNAGSRFPPAFEVCLYPLTGLIARQRMLAWQFGVAGALILTIALGASRFASSRLSMPVERLARFSADASHQLKTPVTVLRAGLEELLASEKLHPETREEVSALVHQTFRLTSVIEDLMLLSRMDAGRLKLEFNPVNLTQIVEGWLDDFSAFSEPPEIKVETDFPPALMIEGEKRYTTLIVQNLLENARKYNRPSGRIRISIGREDDRAVLTIGNTGRPISPAAREHIFERFHRGSAGENVPGHGLGLNLARELARLHRGELVLKVSEADWTEFEVNFHAL